MMNVVRTRPWVCPTCLRRVSRAPQIRWLSAAPIAGHGAGHPPHPADHSSPSLRHDDSLLREIFDSSPAWKSFARSGAGRPNVGLFRNRFLTRPEGFIAFADTTLAKAQRIVDKVLNATSLREYKEMVRDLDRLSDLLCRVLDMSDFVRVTHPDLRIQRAAAEAWSMVYQYMNELNTTTGLNEQLGRAMENPDITASWTEEEMTVAHMLKLDFTKSAVNLPKRSRDKFVQLSQQISDVGAKFVDQMTPERARLVFPSTSFQGMDPRLAHSLSSRGSISLRTLSPEAGAALRTVHDEDTRKELYCGMRTASRKSVDMLDTMIKLRAELASLAGFESYGHMALRDRMMAKSPESVQQYLLALARHNAPMAKQEVEDLVREKQRLLHTADGTFHPWDKDFYMDSIRHKLRSKTRFDDFLSAYFSVGTVIQGLSRLFTRLYGIRLVPRETLPGETWHPDVRHLDVISESEGRVAVLYCDLFYRPDKSPNPAHFTVRCSREILESELEEAAAQTNASCGTPLFETAEDAATDGMEWSRRGGRAKQLPTIALVCDFNTSPTDRAALLTFHQVETLFHEMGHAIHSILARTSLQNVAGTRCATDFAELPSTLMEHFAADPSVLALFARHYKTDEPVPYELIAERMRLSRRFEGCDTENQIILAMLDQEYHSSLAMDPTFDSTEILHKLQRTYGNVPVDPPGTRWQGFFGHLFGYGSTYYSYLFDRVLAEHVWKVVFSAGKDGASVDRSNGERLKENLLKWGGGRDPWLCLANTLQDDRLAAGDERAMAVVGSWGVTK